MDGVVLLLLLWMSDDVIKRSVLHRLAKKIADLRAKQCFRLSYAEN
jgi:hypothetical protein